MRLTRSADYMLRCVDYLARQDPNAVVSRREIVAATEIPDTLFRKLVQQLRRAGIVEITRGVRGGYRLAVPADQLTLLDVIRAAVGDMALNDCVVRPWSCRRSPTCAIHMVLGEATRKVHEVLSGVSFAQLAQAASCLRGPVELCPQSATLASAPREEGHRSA